MKPDFHSLECIKTLSGFLGVWSDRYYHFDLEEEFLKRNQILINIAAGLDCSAGGVVAVLAALLSLAVEVGHFQPDESLRRV